MAHVQVSKLSTQELSQLACTYAALILHDDEQQITGDKINKLVSASGVKIEPYWPKVFANVLAGKDITSFFSFGSAASGPAASGPTASGPAPAATAGPAAEKKKQQKKKEAPPPPPAAEEEEMDMGDLFG